MRKGSLSTTTIVLVLIVCAISGVLFTTRNSSAQNDDVRVLYVSQDVDIWRDDSFRASLDLDPIFNITHQNPFSVNFSSYENGTALLDDYDLVCILDVDLSLANQTILKDFVEVGGGLLILCGRDITTNPTLFVTLEIIGLYDIGNVSISTESALSSGINSSSPLEDNIDWNSCPAVENYTSFGDTLDSSFDGEPLIIKSPRDDSIVTTFDPLVFTKDLGTGRIGVITYWLEGQDNIQFLLWAYYNYFTYAFTWITLNQPSRIESYASWKFSPVPHILSQIILTCIMGILVFLTVFLIIKIRRLSNKTRDSLAEISFEVDTSISSDSAKKKSSRRKIFRPRRMRKEEITDWEEIGFHRQTIRLFYSVYNLSVFWDSPTVNGFLCVSKIYKSLPLSSRKL